MGSLCTRLLPEGSQRGAIFNIASATLGAGALGLPYAFKQSGVVLALLWLTLAALATVYSIRLLLVASQIASHRCKRVVDSYEDLAEAVFGRAMRHVVEGMMILFCFGTAIAYCVAVGDILEPVRRLEFMPDCFRSEDHGRSVVMVTFWVALMFPLSLLRSVGSLQFSSFLGVAAILFLVIATVYHCVSHRITDDWDCTAGGGLECNSPTRMVRLDMDTMSAIPLVMFAFTCQVNVYDIYRELRRPSTRKMMRITWVGMLGICFMVYATIGFFGYLDFKDTVQGNVLLNLAYAVGEDVVITVAFVSIAITVVVAFPLVVFPCRESIFSVLTAPATPEDRDHIIDEYRTGDQKSRERYVVGPAARKVSSPFASPPNASEVTDGEPFFEVTIDEKAEPFLPHTQLIPTLVLPTFHVNAEAYYVPPVPTRVYERPPLWQHLLVSSGISIGAIMVALLVPKIQVVFSLLGGICSSFLCFVFPALCVKRLGYNTAANAGACGVVGIECLLWGGVSAGVGSTALTVYSTFAS